MSEKVDNVNNEQIPESPVSDETSAAEASVSGSSAAAKKKLIIGALAAVLVLVAAVFGVSSYRHSSVESMAKKMSARQVASLDKYTALKEIDLSGSTCYDEILSYIESHPDVNVTYSVTADGTAISNKETSIDWTGKDIAGLLSVDASYQPALSRIEIGDAALEDATALAEHFPDAAISFRASVGGQSISSDSTSVDFSKLNSSDVADAAKALAILKNVNSVKLNSGLSFDDYKVLFDARPDIQYDYSFTLFGKEISTQDDTVKFLKVYIGDEGIDQIRTMLPYLPNLTYLSFDRCDTTDEVVNQLRDDFPEIKIAWRIFFDSFSCMTDVEKIWAIGSLNDENIDPIKYCRDVKYLDLGHNDLKYIDFIKDMYQLEVFILGCGTTVDISPLEGNETLEYLEITSTSVSDLSPLASCKNLKHFEMSLTQHITDISPLYGLDLDRFYALYVHSVPEEQFKEFQRLHPDCECDFSCGYGRCDPFNESAWRYYENGGGIAPRYELLRQQIGYDDDYGATRLYTWQDPVEDTES